MNPNNNISVTHQYPPPLFTESPFSSSSDEEPPQPSYDDWFTKVVVIQLANLINKCMSLLFSPISSLLYLLLASSNSSSYPYCKEEEEEEATSFCTKMETFKSSVVLQNNNNNVPMAASNNNNNINQYYNCRSRSGHDLLLIIAKKLGFGFLGAVHACIVLAMVAAVAVVMGVGLVRLWVEEPIFLKERLHFDYTDIHPKALYSFCGGASGGGAAAGRCDNKGGLQRIIPAAASLSTTKNKRDGGIPIGHMFQVSVGLLMPDSEYNRQIGVFQLTAELLGENGQVIAKSSQHCMLRFRSLPIRVMRVFILGVPILLGISTETQTLRIVIMKHKEAAAARSSIRTDAIRITVIPRAGTLSPPQLYEAEIFVKSQLPFFKQLVHRWKWTLYVWVSVNVYIMMVLIMLCCCKPVILSGPVILLRNLQTFQEEEEHNNNNNNNRSAPWRSCRNTSSIANHDERIIREELQLVVPPPPPRHHHPRVVVRLEDLQERPISELLMIRRLQRSRSKREAAAAAPSDQEGNSASSSMSVNTSEDAVVEQEDIVGDAC